MDEAKVAEMKKDCACGSAKMAGACCMAEEKCACGSNKPAGECCFKEKAA